MKHTPLWYLPNIAMEITIFNRQFNYQWAIFHSYAMLNYGYIWALEFHSTECEPSTLSGYRYLFVAPCIATSSYTHDMDGPWCQWTADPGGDIGGRIIGESVGTNQEQQGYRLQTGWVIKKQTWWGCQLLQWWPCFTSSSRKLQESIKKQIDMADQQALEMAYGLQSCSIAHIQSYCKDCCKSQVSHTLVSCLHQSNLQ